MDELEACRLGLEPQVVGYVEPRYMTYLIAQETYNNERSQHNRGQEARQHFSVPEQQRPPRKKMSRIL